MQTMMTNQSTIERVDSNSATMLPISLIFFKKKKQNIIFSWQKSACVVLPSTAEPVANGGDELETFAI